MKILKLIFINIFFFYLLFSFLIFIIPYTYKFFNFFQNIQVSGKNFDQRSILPNYNNIDWSSIHFDEISKLKTDYYDFIGWRRHDFNGETINIKNGYRLNKNDNIISSLHVEFYGGSTLWGTGSDDKNTIPSIFERKSNLKTFNHGESGWWSRQSLSLKINKSLNDSETKKLIIFYDGVNEVYHRCRNENFNISTNRQDQIRSKISNNSKFSLGYHLEPLLELANLVRLKLFKNSNKNMNFYNCSSDPEKAKLVAIQMLEIWRNAKILSESKGNEFIAILQPVAFVGSPELKHLPYLEDMWPGLKNEYIRVYEEIMKNLQEYNDLNILDLKNAFDTNNTDGFIYIDFCHVSPNGNKIIVDLILDYLKNKDLI